MTSLIYYKDQYQKEAEAKIVAIENNQVQLDQTLFIPAGNTEPGDLGQISGNPLTGSKKDNENICHLVFKNEIGNEKMEQALKQANTDITTGIPIKSYFDKERPGFHWTQVGTYPPIPDGGLHVKNTREIGGISLVQAVLKKGKWKIIFECK